MEGIPVPNNVPSGERHIDIVIVIDDLKEEASKSKMAVDIFIKHSHHCKMSVMFLVQKLYRKTHQMRVLSQNAYMLVFVKNPRDFLYPSTR